MKKIIALVMFCVLLFHAGCSDKGPIVIISDEGNYYNVVLDFISEPDHRIVGAEYAGQIKRVRPNFEVLIDSYISEITMNDDTYNIMLKRAVDVRLQVHQEYKEEIEGMAEVLASTSENVRGDNKLSIDELYLFNLVPDVLRITQCSFLSVSGKLSETGKVMAVRNLDWPGGSMNQIPKIQAVITYKYKNIEVCSIGYLGYMGIITGFNSKKVFSAILDSSTGERYDSKARYSYPMDLRFALENKSTMDDVAEFMKDLEREYTTNHLIAISDPEESKVLENNFSGHGSNMKRALRSSNSILNDGITWDIENAVAAVNSFILKGNHDNHSTFKGNTERWESLKTELVEKGDIVTFEEMKEIISFDNNDGPGQMSTGDLYSNMNQMIIVFEPDTFNLEVSFRPWDASVLPDDPVFTKINVFQN